MGGDDAAGGALEELVGGPPIRYPDDAAARVEEHGGNVEVVSHHDGYMRRFGLMHQRTLSLSQNGKRLLGVDRLDYSQGMMRLRKDVPFAIHFHVHPNSLCRRGDGPNVAIIELASGEVWRFTLEGAQLAVEDGTYYADSAGPRRALQIVARGATFGETEVRWVLEMQRAAESG